jgi:hypothetical protein
MAALEPLASRLARQLAEGGFSATWSIEDAAQFRAIESWSKPRITPDVALLAKDAVGGAPAENFAARLEGHFAAGMNVRSMHIPGSAARTMNHRALFAAGIRSIVVDQPVTGGARALPFGLRQFSPRLVVPRGGWFAGWFGGGPRQFIAAATGGMLLAGIDLVRLRSKAARGWRAVEQIIRELDDARAEGVIGVATLSEAVRQLAESSAVRPQRSILRAAA